MDCEGGTGGFRGEGGCEWGEAGGVGDQDVLGLLGLGGAGFGCVERVVVKSKGGFVWVVPIKKGGAETKKKARSIRET